MAPNENYRPQRKEIRPRYMPDTSAQIADSVRTTGYTDRLASAFRAAIARVKGRR